MRENPGTIRVGISGWRYPPWRGVFYPKGLPQRSELSYAAERMDSVELNGSFYSLQRPSSYERWFQETPEGFVFTVKGSRFITHMLRLREPRVPLANYFASGVLRLGAKLGPLLWQLPARTTFDAELLDHFFTALPTTTTAAAALAAEHDQRVTAPDTVPPVDRPLRHALEVRHPSFLNEACYEILRRHRVSLVVADTAGRFPEPRELTTDFVYVRLHGADELYVSGYSAERLASWAEQLLAWARPAEGAGRDVYVYFDNDVKVHAPFNALSLKEALRATAPVE